MAACLARRDIVDFRPARQHSSRGNWMDHPDKHHHHSGRPFHASDSADAIRDLFSERVLGAARSRAPSLLANETGATSEGTAAPQRAVRPYTRIPTYPN